MKQAGSASYHGFDSYYAWLNDLYRKKRTKLALALQGAGLRPIIPEGGFFIMADTSAVKIPPKYEELTSDTSDQALGPDGRVTRDWAFCRFLTTEIGVAAIPPSAFHSKASKPLAANLARFAFCKTDEELDEAASRLLKLRSYLK